MTSFFGELKRRNVVKVAVAYAIVGWLLIEVTSTVFPVLQIPDWAIALVTMLLILGFPIALILSWAYEITPEGMKRSHEIPVTESTTHVIGRKIDFVIIGVLAIAVAFFAVERFVLVEEAPSSPASTVDRRSIAVIPFSYNSADEENAEFFSDGIHDNLLTQLTKISSLKVISRTSVMEYRDTTKNMRQIGQELDVATILEGGVRRAGDVLQINVQLIDVETDEHLWAEVYDRELTAENTFAILREMASSIAEALQATLTPQEVARLNEVPTDSRRAWDLYQSGNDYLRASDSTTIYALAAAVWERAVVEDPGFALAWAALSRGHSGTYFFGVDPTESRRQLAREALDRAFALAPDLPEAHLAMGYYHYHGFRDYERALLEFDIAEQGMPGDAQIPQARAYVYRRMGRWEDSLADMERAIRLDPRNIEQLNFQATTYRRLRNYNQSSEIHARILEIQPDNAISQWAIAYDRLLGNGDPSLLASVAENPSVALPVDLRGWSGWLAALYEQDYELALRVLDGWNTELDVEMYRYIPLSSYYAVTHQLAGRDDAAALLFQSARAVIEQALETNPEDPRLYMTLAESLAGLGESDAAASAALEGIRLLSAVEDAARDQRLLKDAIVRALGPAGAVDVVIEQLDAYLGSPGDWSIEGLLPDPRLDPIRDDPRFQALVEKYRRP